MGFKYDINRYLAAHGDRVPVKSLAEIIKSRPLPSHRRRAAGAGAKRAREWTRDAPACKAERAYREQVRAAVDEDDGRAEARRVGLSDVEQSAAADRRPQHARRRQQPVLLADHRLPGDPGADGLHARRTLAGGHDVLRPRVVGADADQAAPTPTSRRRITAARPRARRRLR